MKPIGRIRQFIEYKGITFNAFDKSIGVGHGYIGKQIKNDASIGSDIMEKIGSVYVDLNLNWVITGQGEMIGTNENNLLNEPKSIYITKRDVCLTCQEKDKLIQAKEETIETLKEVVKSLKDQIELINGHH